MDRQFFNLDTLEGGITRELAPGITTSIFAGEQAMVSVVRFAPDARGTIHEHPEEQWGICREGSGVRIQNGERIDVKAGDFWITPGGTAHGMEAGVDGMVVIDVFAPPRGAYTKSGSGFAASES